MKKLFSSFVVAGTVASFAFCGKKDKAKSTTTKNAKTENKEGGSGASSATSKTVVIRKKAKGKFKIGYVASNLDYALNLRNTIKLYTQDVTAKSDTGKEYFELPSGLFLESSTKYNSIVHEYEAEDYTISLNLLKAFLLRKAILLDSDEEDGSTHTKYTDAAIDPYSNSKPWSKRKYTSYDMTALNALFVNNNKNPNEQPLPAYVLPAHYYSRTMMTDKGLQLQHIQHKNDAIFGITGGTRDTIATIEEFENMFTMEVVLKIYNVLKDKTEPTALDLQKAFKAAGLKVVSNVKFGDITKYSDNINDLNTVYFNAGRRSDAKIPIKKIMTDKQTKIINNVNEYFFKHLKVLPAKFQSQISWLEGISKIGFRFVLTKGDKMQPSQFKTKETKEITKLITTLNASKKAAESWLNKLESIKNSKITSAPLYKDITKINKEFLSSNMAPKKMLSDKTKLASKNIDALFIHVTDEKENSSDVYKSVVEKKEFKDTKLFFIGEKAKAQSGASSKTFAGGNVSTASFNQYAAAYVGGFQAAVGAIKYSSSEDEYEETNVVFLIGATSESEDKKKAFAFRRGVEAAAAHPAYSKYLKVKFVSKTADSSKSSKKLYREISEWKSIDDSKTKLYEFSSSDTFSDGDRRIVYIAGATARDWAGESTNNGVKMWNKGDDTGLIGALYNYKKVSSDDSTDESLSSKTFGGSGVWILLDDNHESPNSPLIDPSSNKGDEFERRQIQFMGFLGGEASGTTNYVKFAIRGHFMGQANYMVGKHTIFGAPITPYQAKFKPTDSGVTSEEVRKQPWQFQKTGKDTVGKNYDRFRKSLAYAWSLEITEAEITKSSPWLK